MGAADIHHADALPVGVPGQQAGDLEGNGARADLDVERVADLQSQPFRRGRAQQHRVRIEHVEHDAGALGQQHGLHLRGAQRVEAQNAENVRAARKRNLEIHGRVCRLDLRQAREARVERLLESGARAAHHQVGFSGEMPGRQFEFVDCARVDEMHCNAQRHAQRDGENGEGGASRVFAQRAENERVEEGKSQLSI